MIYSQIEQLQIKYLKMNLAGKPNKNKTEQKGYGLENSFRYYMSQPENGGKLVENLEKNISLYNYRKEPRKFEVHMIGFAEIKKNNSKIEISSINYDFYKPKKIELKHERVEIQYDALNMEFTKGQEFISLDISEKLKIIARDDISNKSLSGVNIFELANIAIDNDKGDIMQKRFQNKISKENVLNYNQKLLFFSQYLQTNFNSAQKRVPNIIKFVKVDSNTNINTDAEKEIYLFHASFIREIDGAYKVIKEYDFLQYSGLKEFNINESEEITKFKENDILLFELKDSSIDNKALECLNNNYNVLNGHIKLLKEDSAFKDCRFFYIGIQEGKSESVQIVNSKICEETRKKESSGCLKVKLFHFVNGKIFNKEFREENAEKMKVLDLLKDERQEINDKIEGLEIRLVGLENRLDRLEIRLDGLETNLNNIGGKLDKLGNMIYFIFTIVVIFVAIMIVKK